MLEWASRTHSRHSINSYPRLEPAPLSSFVPVFCVCETPSSIHCTVTDSTDFKVSLADRIPATKHIIERGHSRIWSNMRYPYMRKLRAVTSCGIHMRYWPVVHAITCFPQVKRAGSWVHRRLVTSFGLYSISAKTYNIPSQPSLSCNLSIQNLSGQVGDSRCVDHLFHDRSWLFYAIYTRARYYACALCVDQHQAGSCPFHIMWILSFWPPVSLQGLQSFRSHAFGTSGISLVVSSCRSIFHCPLSWYSTNSMGRYAPVLCRLRHML